MNLIQFFDLSLQGRSGNPALDWQAPPGASTTSTFGDLEVRSNRLAHLLQARGCQAGDRVCVYLKNRSEFIDLYLACLKLGVIFVPINILYRERETDHIVSDVEPKAIVVSGDFPSRGHSWQVEEMTTNALSLPSSRPTVDLDGDAPALIMYTSGTTGRAKGAVLTHNNVAANTLALLTLWQITAFDRFLFSLPLFHLHGLGLGIHCWLASGCRMKLLERFDQGTAEQFFLDFRPTLFFGVPTIYTRLNQISNQAAAEIGQFMRLFICGSAPLPAQLFEKFRTRFGHTILERYGMTETFINMSNPYTGERRPGSVGLPVAGVSVRLLDGEGHLVKSGEIGEVHVRGANVFAGYWRNAEATQAAFRDGYFRTGDLAVRAADGYYELRGRISDLIISGGFNIYPREIEEFLQAQPEIVEAAVVGVPHPTWGEAPIAYLVARQPFDPTEMKLRCKSSLASFKKPHEIHIVEQLPRNAMGKVDKKRLSELSVKC
jgi:malonyl-CoA/methylmalonyl-CoA synthetase